MKIFQITAKLFFVLLLVLPLTVQQAHSQVRDGNLGLGVVVGDPTGITAKLWLDDLNALAGTAAWSFRGNTSLQLNADYLRHNFDHIDLNRGSMAFYYGLGGRLLAREGNRDDRFGVRVPFGLSYFFANDPIEIFAEVVPILDIVPGTDFTSNSGVGVRYYF
ncbi:MAG: hypothetical protein WD038_07290 [Balneolales bacterium]